MNINEKLEATTMSILEESAFLFSEPLEKAPKILPENMLGCEMVFDNDKKGVITIFCERAIAISLAANMLGCEEDDQKANDSAESALKEFTNILSGNLITEIFGTKIIVNLSLPIFIGISKLNSASEKGELVWFDVDDYKMVVMMTVE